MMCWLCGYGLQTGELWVCRTIDQHITPHQLYRACTQMHIMHKHQTASDRELYSLLKKWARSSFIEIRKQRSVKMNNTVETTNMCQSCIRDCVSRPAIHMLKVNISAQGVILSTGCACVFWWKAGKWGKTGINIHYLRSSFNQVKADI